MRPFVQRVEEFYQGRVDFHVLNVDHLSSRDLMNKYQVTGIPLIVLLDAQGEVFEILLGYQTEDQLFAAVERLLAAQANRN
jgi:thioredoxin-related protein